MLLLFQLLLPLSLLQGLPATLLPPSLPCAITSTTYTCTGAPLAFYQTVLLAATTLLTLHLAANMYLVHNILTR